MKEITVRPAEKKDTALILELICSLAEYEHMKEQVTATRELLEQNIFEHRYAQVLIAEVDGEAAGFALFFYNFSTFLGKPGIYLEDLFIKSEFRGLGIGTTLISRLAQTAEEQGCGRLEWACLDWNKPSIQFYRNLGAAAQDEWTVYRLTGDTLTAVAKRGV